MSARVVHRLTGYDRDTELLAIEHEIPQKDISRVKEIAGVGPDDPDAVGSAIREHAHVEPTGSSRAPIV